MKKEIPFSKLVKKTRLSRRMTVEEFAVAVGTTYHSIYAWERGLRNPPRGYQAMLRERFEIWKSLKKNAR